MIGCDKTPAYQVQFEICSEQTKLNLWYKQKRGIGRSACCAQKQPATLKLTDQKTTTLKGKRFLCGTKQTSSWSARVCKHPGSRFIVKELAGRTRRLYSAINKLCIWKWLGKWMQSILNEVVGIDVQLLVDGRILPVEWLKIEERIEDKCKAAFL